MKIKNETCYLSLEDDGISNKDNIRKIIIPEGISVLGTGTIHSLPNLEEIDFPSTLRVISNSAITNCPKLTVSGLRFKNNKFYMENINSIRPSRESKFRDDYYKKMSAIICSEATSFEEKCDIYNQLVLTMHKDAQLEFTKLFLSSFTESNYNLSPLIEKIKDGQILNCADLQIFSILLQKDMNLPIQPIVFSPHNQKLACACIDNTVSVGYISLLWAAERRVQNQKDTIAINTFLLYAIAHEFQHIRQRKNAENINFDSNYLFNQIDYIDSEIQATCDNYEKGYSYSNFHDSSPDEIRADLDAYDILLKMVTSFENLEFKFKMLEFIEKLKLERIKEAHQIDESGNIKIYDYRLNAFEDLLSRNNLSNNEREKLNKLKSLYLNVLKKANNLGIDFFSKEIEYYEISHNKKESINNESTL